MQGRGTDGSRREGTRPCRRSWGGSASAPPEEEGRRSAGTSNLRWRGEAGRGGNEKEVGQP
jgi:hypothetical protein